METYQKRWIIKHLDYLCKFTPNPSLIALCCNFDSFLSAQDAKIIHQKLTCDYDKNCKLYISIIIDEKVTLNYFLRLLSKLDNHYKVFKLLALGHSGFEEIESDFTEAETNGVLKLFQLLIHSKCNITRLLIFSCSQDIISIQDLADIYFPTGVEKDFNILLADIEQEDE